MGQREGDGGWRIYFEDHRAATADFYLDKGTAAAVPEHHWGKESNYMPPGCFGKPTR